MPRTVLDYPEARSCHGQDELREARPRRLRQAIKKTVANTGHEDVLLGERALRQERGARTPARTGSSPLPASCSRSTTSSSSCPGEARDGRTRQASGLPRRSTKACARSRTRHASHNGHPGRHPRDRRGSTRDTAPVFDRLTARQSPETPAAERAEVHRGDLVMLPGVPRRKSEPASRNTCRVVRVM